MIADLQWDLVMTRIQMRKRKKKSKKKKKKRIKRKKKYKWSTSKGKEVKNQRKHPMYREDKWHANKK